MFNKKIVRMTSTFHYEDGSQCISYWGPDEAMDIDVVKLVSTAQTLIIAPPPTAESHADEVELPEFLPRLPQNFRWHVEGAFYKLQKHLHGEWHTMDSIDFLVAHNIENRQWSIEQVLRKYVYIDGVEPMAECGHRPVDGHWYVKHCNVDECYNFFIEDGTKPTHGESDDLVDTVVGEEYDDEGRYIGGLRNELGLPAPHRTKREGCYSGQCSMDDTCVVEACEHYGLQVP